MPPDANLYDPALLEPAETLAQRWGAVGSDGTRGMPPTASPADMEGWPADLKLVFVTKLAQLAADAPLCSTVTRQIDSLYGLGKILDPEVCCAVLCLVCAYMESSM